MKKIEFTLSDFCRILAFRMNRICAIVMGILLFIPFSLSAQEEYEPGIVWIKTDNAEIIPVKGADSRDVNFAKILYDFNIIDITQPYWFAKTAELRKIYELKTHFSEDSLLLALDRLNVQKKLFVAIEKRPLPKLLSEPVDYMWWLTNNDPNNDYLWYLQTIQAPLAWEITKGDTNVKVALLESAIDPLHPDLIGKISPPYDFFKGTPFSFSESSNKNHGTSVATLIAAETTDAGHTPNGQLASIGYNTRIMILAENSNAAAVDVSGYKPGVYNVILIVDGIAVDAQTLIIQ